MGSTTVLPVCHLVDAMGGSEHLFGKERVVLALMEAQRCSGAVAPRLVTFAPSRLGECAAKAGFPVRWLAEKNARFLRVWLPALRRELASIEGTVLHTHGYKANLVGRLLRRRRTRIIATCHGWVDQTWALRLYNFLDRGTAWRSDAVAVPDAQMIQRFCWRRHVRAIPNGIAEAPVPTPEARRQARQHFNWPDETFVVGMLGRLSQEKGIFEFVEAARRETDDRTLWVAAGVGPLLEWLRSAESRQLRSVGYVDAPDFLAGLDVFVQPSRTEALSLSLLEAARAGLPIVATRVGATETAVRHEHEALIVPPGSSDALRLAVARLRDDRPLAATLGRQARQRFEEALGIKAMHQAYLRLYRGDGAS